jgi:hypothetical protein
MEEIATDTIPHGVDSDADSDSGSNSEVEMRGSDTEWELLDPESVHNRNKREQAQSTFDLSEKRPNHGEDLSVSGSWTNPTFESLAQPSGSMRNLVATTLERLKAGPTCLACWEAKVQCDNDRPRCGKCVTQGVKCDYTLPTPGGTFVLALFNYDTDDRTCVSFRKGNIIQVITQLKSGWSDGVLDGVRGWFPSNYCVGIDAVIKPPEKNEVMDLPKTEESDHGDRQADTGAWTQGLYSARGEDERKDELDKNNRFSSRYHQSMLTRPDPVGIPLVSALPTMENTSDSFGIRPVRDVDRLPSMLPAPEYNDLSTGKSLAGAEKNGAVSGALNQRELFIMVVNLSPRI